MSNARILVSKKQLAERCGVTAAAVSMQIKRGVFEGAVVGTGERSRIDINHPNVQKWIQKKTQPPEEKKAPAQKKKPAPTSKKKPTEQKKVPSPPPEEKKAPVRRKPIDQFDMVDEQIRAYLKWTLEEIITAFGSQPGFEDFLTAAKKMEDIHAARLKNAEKEGELVHRELVRKGVMEPIDSAHIKILTDGARSLSKEVFGLVKAGQTEEEIYQTVQKRLESFIRPIKPKITRAIENA